jgi:hypothetical protein
VAKFVFVSWDGGGNVAVALGIGAALLSRAHSVTVLGPTSLRGSIQSVGLRHRELGPPPPREPASRSQYLVDVVGSTAMREDLCQLVEQLDPDGLVIDCNLAWALELPGSVPTAVLVHTALGLYLPVWQQVIDAANGRRTACGLPPLRPAAEAWSSHDLLLVASVTHFDRPPEPLPPNAAYVGLVKSPVRRGAPATGVLGAGGQPLVLVSYSTDRLQNHAARIQGALDALAELPVRVIASTSGAFGIEQLSVPANATVVEYVPHDQVMPRAAVVVAHAGHGTTIAALSQGVPLVCVPGLGRDQVPIAGRVAELGLGIMLADEATPPDIRTAVTTILADSSYRRRAEEFKNRCGQPPPGAKTAAERLEAMLEKR